MGFRVQSSGFGFQGSGFRVQASKVHAYYTQPLKDVEGLTLATQLTPYPRVLP